MAEDLLASQEGGGGVPHSQSEQSAEPQNLLSLTEIEPWSFRLQPGH